MKLLFIANTSYNFYNFRLPLLKALKEREYEVFLAAPEDEYTPYLKEEFKFYKLSKLDRKGINPLKELLFFWELRELIKQLNPNLVVNITIKPNIWGNIASGILEIPSISIVTGLGYSFTQKKFPLYQIVKNLYRTSLRYPQKVIFQNPDDAELFVKEQLINPEKVKVILGSGIDLNYFKPSPNKKKNPFVVFGYVGRLLWDKGLKELIEAVSILKNKGYFFKVYLLGKPDEGNPKSIPLGQIQQWDKEGLITYKGFSRDVRPFLEKIDCFVYPSYREGVPRAILEAMAMEKPIITTKVPGCKETVIEGVNGFLVPPKNSKALAQAMEKFLNLPEEDKLKMGKNSRKLVEDKFSVEKIIREYLSVIEEVLKK